MATDRPQPGPDQPRCSTCHWWFDGFVRDRGRRTCVLITGMRHWDEAKARFGGERPLTTSPDFGCVLWETDTRKNAVSQNCS